MTVETYYTFEHDSVLTALRESRANQQVRGTGLVLTGIMGSGKSVTGALAAASLGLPFVDTDAVIEAEAGCSISSIFSEQGEAAFRALESDVIYRVTQGAPAVVATGGGAALSVENRRNMRRFGPVLWLHANRRALQQRLSDCGTRPLLAGDISPADRALQLELVRSPAYTAAADGAVDTSRKSPENAAKAVCEIYNRLIGPQEHKPTSGIAHLHMELGDRSYPLWLGAGILGSIAGEIVTRCSPNRVCILTHPGLAAQYAAPIASQLEALGIPTQISCIPPGERFKNLNTIARFYSAFVEAKLDRKSLVIAVGGGVIGDMAGFAAASYLRGIAFVQVPTTLLAQVDSSIGGKTGVDLPEGKNLVGAFHQPKAVILDTDTLKSLPLRELRSGLAEVIKYGIISDSSFFYQTQDNLPAILKRESAALERAIARSCEIKGAVVSADETEQGLRAILNFGHTVGHALETATRYRRYRHGEAISIGMVSACLVGEELGITPAEVTSQVVSCLNAAGLPTVFPADVSLDEIHRGMLLDKKTVSGKLKFVLAESVGTVTVVSDIDASAVTSALNRHLNLA